MCSCVLVGVFREELMPFRSLVDDAGAGTVVLLMRTGQDCIAIRVFC